MPPSSHTSEDNSLPGISVVIPAYRSGVTLPPLVEQLCEVLRQQPLPFEIIIVDDDSNDGTWAVIEELAVKIHEIRGQSLMRNFGQHNALLAGIRMATYDTIVTMDDDLQHPPSVVPELLAALTPSLDVIYGAPEHEAHGFFRNVASVVTKYTLQNATGAKTARMVSAFRVFRTRLRTAFADYNHPYVNIDVLLTWGTNRFAAIRVRRDERRVGESSYTLGKLMIHTFNMLTGFSALPLRIASISGFIFTLFGFAVLTFVVTRYLIAGTTMPGFPFLASVIAIFSGAQLFALGVIGEYLARMHFRSMNKPAYAVKHRTESVKQ